MRWITILQLSADMLVGVRQNHAAIAASFCIRRALTWAFGTSGSSGRCSGEPARKGYEWVCDWAFNLDTEIRKIISNMNNYDNYIHVSVQFCDHLSIQDFSWVLSAFWPLLDRCLNGFLWDIGQGPPSSLGFRRRRRGAGLGRLGRWRRPQLLGLLAVLTEELRHLSILKIPRCFRIFFKSIFNDVVSFENSFTQKVLLFLFTRGSASSRFHLEVHVQTHVPSAKGSFSCKGI